MEKTANRLIPESMFYVLEKTANRLKKTAHRLDKTTNRLEKTANCLFPESVFLF